MRPVDDAWRGGKAFDDSGWTAVTGGSGNIGYNQNVRLGSRFSLDVGDKMAGLRTSCYVRVPFTYTGNLQNVGGLTLQIHYNDGFVAYLNGIEIARRNFTGTPVWNSAADKPLDPDAFESIAIGNFADVLRAGDNVLALQGLTAVPSSTDFLLSAALVVQESAGLPSRARVSTYNAPLRLDASTPVQARRWSAAAGVR